VEDPVQKQDKTDGKEGGENVRQEHGTIVITGLGEEIFVALIAALFHLERFFEAKAPGREHVTLVAFWTLDVEDAISFAAFAKNTHVALLFY